MLRHLKTINHIKTINRLHIIMEKSNYNASIWNINGYNDTSLLKLTMKQYGKSPRHPSTPFSDNGRHWTTHHLVYTPTLLLDYSNRCGEVVNFLTVTEISGWIDFWKKKPCSISIGQNMWYNSHSVSQASKYEENKRRKEKKCTNEQLLRITPCAN